MSSQENAQSGCMMDLGLVVNVPMIINEEEWNYYIRPRMEQWNDLDVIPQTDHPRR